MFLGVTLIILIFLFFLNLMHSDIQVINNGFIEHLVDKSIGLW